MAIITKHFSTTAGPGADGTASTWDKREPLFSSGNWSSIITGFAFNGSDSLCCRVGPGTYTLSQQLESGLFANPPTRANQLSIVGADASGNEITPSETWSSAGQDFDYSAFPHIETTGNFDMVSLAHCDFFGLSLEASAYSASRTMVATLATINWCVFELSASNTSSRIFAFSGVNVSNSIFKCTGTGYDNIGLHRNSVFFNCKFRGNGSASSGSRNGVVFNGASDNSRFYNCTVSDNVGNGVSSTSTNVSQGHFFVNCVIANNDGSGIFPNNTASQTTRNVIHNCFISGSGAYNIDGRGAALLNVVNCRMFGAGTGNVNAGLGNDVLLNNLTAAGTDADEYVNAASGDYRVKKTSSYWGLGIGAGDEPSAGGSGGVPLIGTGGLVY